MRKRNAFSALARPHPRHPKNSHAAAKITISTEQKNILGSIAPTERHRHSMLKLQRKGRGTILTFKTRPSQNPTANGDGDIAIALAGPLVVIFFGDRW